LADVDSLKTQLAAAQGEPAWQAVEDLRRRLWETERSYEHKRLELVRSLGCSHMGLQHSDGCCVSSRLLVCWFATCIELAARLAPKLTRHPGPASGPSLITLCTAVLYPATSP
jgi:hypothetical protein